MTQANNQTIIRPFRDENLVLASRNQGKLIELQNFLRPYYVEVIPVTRFDLPEIPETETSFQGNAKLKALTIAKATAMPSLADDSGICIHALNGNPGVYSADWAGENKDFSVAINRVLTELNGKKDRKADVVCVLALAWPDGHVEFVEGKITCDIAEEPRGTNGFGYDAILIPAGSDLTFGEMDPEEKQKISHRAIAMRQLVRTYFS
ncbi:MAG: RdgB/HAM1 family non-canonical purine NTP pyrophosphatase [Alphaproteobacteria bacterium]|nr:RdgB/HAM1 family non-canonical purine NTP pyrophosphatase [Alphaproteobacteria bacterium]